jgi:hypothetical protein
MRERAVERSWRRGRPEVLLVTTCVILVAFLGVVTPSVAGATTQPLTITTPNSLPDGTVGQSYSYQLAASGGTAPYTWSEEGTAGKGVGTVFPLGLGLSSSGLISGTPMAPGTDFFGVIVTDATGQQVIGGTSLTVDTGTSLDSTLVPLGTELYSDLDTAEMDIQFAPTPDGPLFGIEAEISSIASQVLIEGCDVYWDTGIPPELDPTNPECPIPEGV